MEDEAFKQAIIARMDAMESSHSGLQAQIQELLDILSSWKAAMKGIEFVGKIVKPIAAVVAAVAAVMAFFHWGPK